MLKKQYRLRKRLDFKRSYRRGKSIKHKCFVLYYAPNYQGEKKIGFSVSKKIGKAVVRNRVKRRLREVCRQNLNAFAAGYNYIFIARYPLQYAKHKDLEAAILVALAELKLKPKVPKAAKADQSQKNGIPKECL